MRLEQSNFFSVVKRGVLLVEDVRLNDNYDARGRKYVFMLDGDMHPG